MSIGTRIVLEGEKEYRQAITNVNKSMSVLKSEMRSVSAEFEGNANSIDALSKKNEILNKQQSEQEKRIKLLRGALENAAKQYGENSRKVQDWQIKLNNANAYLLKLNREINDNEKYMKEAESSTKKTARSIDEYGKQVDGATKKTSIFGDILKANLVSDAISDGVRKLANVIGDSIERSIELASDLEEVQNVVDVTFGKGAENIDSWAESMGDAHGVSVLFSKQFAGTMGAMLKSMQVTDDQVIEMSKNLVQLAGDMASFYNIDIETAFTKIRSGISGETEPLKQLGINLNVANLEAYALSEGIKEAYSEMTQAEQVTLRYNYLLKTTADAQGDFARNIDSLANQQRIADLQREEILMKLGDAIIPSVTRATAKLNEAMDGMGDNLGEVAEILAEGIVDAFVWMVDNSDKVIAGLKGIGAAILTKKAGDGIAYIIKAYKTLTETTKAATVAQEGFNTVSKANVYAAIASAIIGISTALFSYAKNAKEAAIASGDLNYQSEIILRNSRAIREEVESEIKSRQKTIGAIEKEEQVTKKLIDSLYELSDKENKNNEEKAKMLSLVEQLNREMPTLGLSVDGHTGKIIQQESEVRKLVDAELELQRVRVAGEQIASIELDKLKSEESLNELLEEQKRIEEELVEVEEQRRRNLKVPMSSPAGFYTSALITETGKVHKVSKALKDNQEEVEETREKLSELEKEYKTILGYISGDDTIEEASGTIDGFASKYQKFLDEQTQAEIGTLEDRQKQIGKIYDETSKELDKKLKAEERAFAKSQQKRVEEVQKAQDKELAEVEKTHKVKLDLLNEEYLQKIKTVDEDRYNELKKIQDEIDAIDNQQEAEDRALQAREEAEKKAELQSRVESAKTIEERMEAQKELQKHEERVAKERLKEERGLQKDILKEQIETINDSYDEKVKAIEEEQKKEQEKLAEQLKNEKDAVSERYTLKLEALKEEQELEKDALRERQTEYKDYLREQKELAIANSKEIYEADLAKFKMNQALKYEEVVSSEEQMKKAIKDYAFEQLAKGNNRGDAQRIINSNDLTEMMRYYNPSSAIKSSVPQAQSIDYNLIEEAIARGMKKADIDIYLDKKMVGSFVEGKVNSMIRR